MKDLLCIGMFVLGGLTCIVAGHPELAGLGMIVLAGLLRIAWGYEDKRLDELNQRVDALHNYKVRE